MLIVSLAGCAGGAAQTASPAAPVPLATRTPFAALPGGVSDDTIVLGMSAAFTGNSQGLGIELYRGAQAYVESVNARGGINGRKLVIHAYDDGYNPPPAVENTVRLVEQDDVFLLFNYVGTPTITRILPLLKRYQERDTFLFFPFSGAQPQRVPPYDELVYNLRASYSQETAGLVENLLRIGRTRIAVFYQIDAYGRSGWDGVRRALHERDLDLVGEATYQRGATFSQSMQPQVDILKANNPDAIIIIGSYAASAAFIRDARSSGLQVPIANVSFVGSENMLKLLQESGAASGRDYTLNLINSQVVPSYEDTALAAVSDYRAFMDHYNPAPPPWLVDGSYTPLRYSFTSFEGYLNAKLLGTMIERMGTEVSRERIEATMEGLGRIDLGIGVPVIFNRARHQGSNTVYYTTVQAGRLVPLTDWKAWTK